MKQLFLYIFIVLLAYGCSTNKEITKYSELIQDKPDILMVFSKDSTLYTLTHFTVANDSTLLGEGKQEKNNLVQPFRGELKFADMHYIAGESKSFFRGLFTAALVGTVAAYILADENHNEGVSYNLLYPIGNGGSSCPFLYSYTGAGFTLEGEAFGTGLGKQMETTTAIVLKHLDTSSRNHKIRFANERPETHYFKSIEIAAVEHDANAELIADNAENYIPVYSRATPISAQGNNETILPRIAKVDNDFWESGQQPGRGFHDTIELVFENTQNVQEGTLIIDAKNTYFGTFTYYYLNGLLGNKTLEFMNCIETDTAVLRSLQGFLDESSLQVSFWNGSQWIGCGVIRPEADYTTFTKGIRITFPPELGDKVRVRLTALKDVWKIDSFSMDFTPYRKSTIKVLQATSAFKIRKGDFRETLNFADGKYCVLLPGENMELGFSGCEPGKGKKITYGVRTRGYLQPWFPGPESAFAFPVIQVKGDARIEFAKTILRERNYFFSQIYAEWDAKKHLFEGN